MTVVALLSVAPVIEDSMSGEVAKAVDALEGYDVEYETNPMGTVIEAEEIGELFTAAQAAHEAVDADRVSTVLKIDDKRSREGSADEKVEAVEEHLGRAATNSEE
ncbi:MTH1187 family thiamine-binding protein [Natronolimnohabitans sp. A-GB9]|uniref:MTH1187 family thiamine-binding protein n=1 Tax=Natronolimnohabitans sp. A-GB9 TaxID=3069757 RepID=UPI0027B36CA6|nr:MTH1187 family thiamine-binding protein [Natronolimnohabitans sp. A-GB9]MDQ2049763.1 MTH1187 family thiamine-binding protein [Natronolimnohabitans sp. A-GB9]